MSFARELQRQWGEIWFHGSPHATPQPDLGAIWLAGRWQDALWYAGNSPAGTLHVARLRRWLPDLRQKKPWQRLASHAPALQQQPLQRRHRQGRLTPEEQEEILRAARAAGHAGVILQDFTCQRHLSAAVFDPASLQWLGCAQAQNKPED